jgi:hypothetical protein
MQAGVNSPLIVIIQDRRVECGNRPWQTVQEQSIYVLIPDADRDH